MSRAQFKVEANERIILAGTLYRVTEHPALPGIPYIQRGARGFVIQLATPTSERMALKYFKLKYRVPALLQSAEQLAAYASLAGMQAARRIVFAPTTHADLIAKHPALEYGMLMPWLPGLTWYDIVTSKAPLTPYESAKLAQSTAAVLAGLETSGLAHCDIAGANVMINRKQGTIELVDIEELYGPNQPHPVELPAGQDGYQHRQGRSEGQWHANGDRFAGAVIIAEMLGWADARVRQYSADEHYFSAAEMQDPDSARLKILLESLRDQHGAELATLFDQAWRSQTLAECPPLSAWQAALSTIKTETLDAQPVVTNPVVVVGRRAVAPGAAPAPIPLPTNNPIPAGRLQLEGIKLCRNCGAENPQSFTFCKRCGYFIGTSAQKRATTAKSAAKDAAAPAPSAASVKTASPQAVSLQRDNQEIVSAKRVGAGSGQGMRRIVYKEQPPTDNTSNASQPPTDTTGGLIIAGIIMLMIVAVLVLLLMAR